MVPLDSVPEATTADLAFDPEPAVHAVPSAGFEGPGNVGR
jgi:hypothetical protein